MGVPPPKSPPEPKAEGDEVGGLNAGLALEPKSKPEETAGEPEFAGFVVEVLPPPKRPPEGKGEEDEVAGLDAEVVLPPKGLGEPKPEETGTAGLVEELALPPKSPPPEALRLVAEPAGVEPKLWPKSEEVTGLEAKSLVVAPVPWLKIDEAGFPSFGACSAAAVARILLDLTAGAGSLVCFVFVANAAFISFLRAS